MSSLAVTILTSASLMGGMIDLFDSTLKDFGSVPHGSINRHRFVLKNTTPEMIRISGVSSSCKCATPRALSQEAAPGDELVVEVEYNTTTFTGERSMSIYVFFLEPTNETVTLRVTGFSRQDVVFNPGQVDFGVLDAGQKVSKTVKIEYAGALDWKITEAMPSSAFAVQLKELYREPGRVGYQLETELKSDATPGVHGEPLRLKTNDPQTPVVSVFAHATIETDLSASPASLDLGSIKMGEKVAKKIILRGREPFALESIGGQTGGIKVKATEGSRKVHLLSVEFDAHEVGKIDRQLVLRTDIRKSPEFSYRITAQVSK